MAGHANHGLTRWLPGFFSIVSLLGAGLYGAAATAAQVLEFSPPISLSDHQPDMHQAYKPKLVTLSSGRLVAVYNEALENDAAHYVYDTKGDYVRPARDVFVRYCDPQEVDCADIANWSAPSNVSGTALLSSIATDWDGNTDGSAERRPYLGDSEKANVYAAGNRLVITWIDAYCPDGDPATPGLEPVAQRTVTYIARASREVPFGCLYAASSANGALSWTQPVQLTSGLRDAKNDVSRGLGSGHWAIVWQEDPLGLKLGDAEGPGDGASGALVSKGTDIWYTYADPAWADADGGDGLGFWHGPMRVTDNIGEQAAGNYDPVRNALGNLVDRSDIDGGIAGASRPNLAVVDDNERSGKRIAVIAYEETKGAQGLDEGKFIRLHSFPWNNVAANNPAGCLISDPLETSRRVRFVPQKGVGKANGMRMAIFWRQGTVPQGGPADIMLRIGYAGQEDTAVTGLAYTDLVPAVDPACETSDWASAIQLQHAPGLNITSQTPRAASSNLADGTGANPLENARAHRAVMRGDDLYLAWVYTPDGTLAQYTDLATYDLWLRHYDDATSSWEAPVNLSRLPDTAIEVREPRLMGMPGNGSLCEDPKNPADPEYCQAKEVIVAAWGTATNVYDALGGAKNLEILYSRTTDSGGRFEQTVFAPGRRENYRSESQIRTTPGGNVVYSTWAQVNATSGRSDAMFSVGRAITAMADLKMSCVVPDALVSTGMPVSMTMVVSNAGPHDATGITLSGTLPKGLDMKNLPICPVSGRAITCTVPSLKVGESISYNFLAEALYAGTHTLDFSVSSEVDDPDRSNNVESEAIQVKDTPVYDSDSGGCVANPGAGFDPLLAAMLLLALSGIAARANRSYGGEIRQ